MRTENAYCLDGLRTNDAYALDRNGMMAPVVTVSHEVPYHYGYSPDDLIYYYRK